MFGPLRRVKFLITAPFILLMLVVINVMTSPGQWWVQWAALGLGIAWVINLFKLIRDIVVLGGLAAFGAYLFNRNRQSKAVNIAVQLSLERLSVALTAALLETRAVSARRRF